MGKESVGLNEKSFSPLLILILLFSFFGFFFSTVFSFSTICLTFFSTVFSFNAICLIFFSLRFSLSFVTAPS